VAAFVILWPSLPGVSTPWVRAHIPFRLNEGLDIRGGARLSYDVQIGQAIAERRNACRWRTSASSSRATSTSTAARSA
jgi:preprotein translocase subunit SecD